MGLSRSTQPIPPAEAGKCLPQPCLGRANQWTRHRKFLKKQSPSPCSLPKAHFPADRQAREMRENRFPLRWPMNVAKPSIVGRITNRNSGDPTPQKRDQHTLERIQRRPRGSGMIEKFILFSLARSRKLALQAQKGRIRRKAAGIPLASLSRPLHRPRDQPKRLASQFARYKNDRSSPRR